MKRSVRCITISSFLRNKLELTELSAHEIGFSVIVLPGEIAAGRVAADTAEEITEQISPPSAYSEGLPRDPDGHHDLLFSITAFDSMPEL